jgi:hypothetical protein
MPSLLCRLQTWVGWELEQSIPTVVHTVPELSLWTKGIEWSHPSTMSSYSVINVAEHHTQDSDWRKLQWLLRPLKWASGQHEKNWGNTLIPGYRDNQITRYLASLDNLISWRTDTKLRVIKVVQNTARQWLEKLAFSLNTFLVGLPDTVLCRQDY